MRGIDQWDRFSKRGICVFFVVDRQKGTGRAHPVDRGEFFLSQARKWGKGVNQAGLIKGSNKVQMGSYLTRE